MPRPASLALRAAALLLPTVGARPLVAQPGRPAGTTPPVVAVVYRCTDGYRFAVRLAGARRDTAQVSLPFRVATAVQTRAASGVRYAGDGIVVWTKRTRARIEGDGPARDGCLGTAVATPWDEARLLGVEFRAVGQEPGWVLEIDEGRVVRLVADYGATRVVFPGPRPAVVDTSGASTYTLRTEAHALTVVVRPAPCRDAMSGAPSPYTVTLTFDGRALAGCGRVLATVSDTDLTGARWRLVTLDGAPVPPLPARQDARAAHLRFAPLDAPAGGAATGAWRVAGSTGCNRLNGPWRTEGGRLRAGPLAVTRMACLDADAAARERAFLRALERADRYSAAGDRLTLFAGDVAVAVLVAEYLR